jgi:hypothetical protein
VLDNEIDELDLSGCGGAGRDETAAASDALVDVNNDVDNDGNYTTAKSAEGGLDRPVTITRLSDGHF